MILSGPRLDGPPNTAKVDRLILTTPEAATRAVDSVAALGVDFIKVYEGLPPAAFFAITREARAKGLAVGGHVPRALTAAQAADSGQKSIEHVGFVPSSCLAMFDPRAVAAKMPVPPICRGVGLDTLAGHLARAGAWLDPTLVSFLGFVRAADSTLRPGEAMKHVSPEVRNWWREQWSGFPPWPPATWQAVFDTTMSLTGILLRSNAPVLAGTDLGNPEVYPGASLHEELALLVRAGLTPAAALRAATSGAARYLGLADSIGTIGPGKAADLVVLSGNPLADIGNTRRIDAVVLRGRLLRRAVLDSVLR
jgi:imidazolonepropionase-like amidohydrolase